MLGWGGECFDAIVDFFYIVEWLRVAIEKSRSGHERLPLSPHLNLIWMNLALEEHYLFQ